MDAYDRAKSKVASKNEFCPDCFAERELCTCEDEDEWFEPINADKLLDDEWLEDEQPQTDPILRDWTNYRPGLA